MTQPKSIRIAARHSDLARLQAYRVGDRLKAEFPELEVEYNFRASLGDQNLEDPLWKMPEKGVFTEDFVRDLHEGTADLVVHSWKDLPTEARPGLSIAATLPRADQRDLLLMRREKLESVRESKRLRVLTSSPRRAFNLDGFFKNYLPFEIKDVSFENVRGNIPTRMKKLLSGEADALIVAKAAVDRLLEAPEDEFEEAREVIRQTLRSTYQMVLPLAINPTAAAQGALAIEIRSDRSDLAQMLNRIHDHATYEAVTHERKILSSYGGGCHQKIGISILERPFGRVTFLQGLTDAGERLNRVDLETEKHFAKPAGEAAIYPRAEEDATLFSREDLPSEVWERAKKSSFLWIARETAWPSSFQVSHDVFVWTAGLTTWRKLAQKGIWVTGSTEGLGEQEKESLSAISLAVLGKEPRWLKLTHESSAASDPAAVATYKLVPKSGEGVDLKSRTHFFWMSGTAFDRAAELHPEILTSGFHASGPGKTHEHLKARLKNQKPFVFFNLEHFRRSLLGSDS
jgi:hydroxymethylbilane synthase